MWTSIWTSIAIFLGLMALPKPTFAQARIYPLAREVRVLDDQPLPAPVKETYAPKQTIAPPSQLDELKTLLRTMCYGDFMEAAEGMGFTPKQAWAFACA